DVPRGRCRAIAGGAALSRCAGGRRLRVHAGATVAGRTVPRDRGQRRRSMMGAWILAGVTFREAARKKLLWMALLAGLAFLALFGTGLHYHMKVFTARSVLIRRQVLNAMLMMGLYAVDLLTGLMMVLTSL